MQLVTLFLARSPICLALEPFTKYHSSCWLSILLEVSSSFLRSKTNGIVWVGKEAGESPA
jgi:hypothetical protein